MAEKSFKERVRLEIIKAAKKYKEIYVDYEYLICSEAFAKRSYYIVDAKKDNFQHLTGVHSQISAQSFFDKCIDDSLSEDDFDFIKKGQDEKSVKGTVRPKIKALPDMMELFRDGLLAEEDFKKNRVICTFATADGNCTLGFVNSGKARPKSLIKGNELKNPKPIELILRKKAGTELFDEMVVGNEEFIRKYQDEVQKLISDDFFKKKIEIVFEINSNPTVWSDQEVHFTMKDGTEVSLIIKKTFCELKLIGKDNLETIFYAIWEILAWNDGYFYKPIEYKINGVEHDINKLIKMPYYITDSKWKKSALLIGRNKREISENIIVKYIQIRNTGRKQKSLNKTMFSSYFYLHSADYSSLNIEHRLVLLMHICDGVAIEFLNGNLKNNSGNILKVLDCVDIGSRSTRKYKAGADMLGIPSDKAKVALQDTRTELTHYIYKPLSLGSFVSDPNSDTDNMINLYAFYVLDLALRVAVLESIGATIEDSMKEYLLDENLDWIRLEKHLDEDCVIPRNSLRQMLQKLQAIKGEND